MIFWYYLVLWYGWYSIVKFFYQMFERWKSWYNWLWQMCRWSVWALFMTVLLNLVYILFLLCAKWWFLCVCNRPHSMNTINIVWRPSRTRFFLNVFSGEYNVIQKSNNNNCPISDSLWYGSALPCCSLLFLT